MSLGFTTANSKNQSLNSVKVGKIDAAKIITVPGVPDNTLLAQTTTSTALGSTYTPIIFDDLIANNISSGVVLDTSSTGRITLSEIGSYRIRAVMSIFVNISGTTAPFVFMIKGGIRTASVVVADGQSDVHIIESSQSPENVSVTTGTYTAVLQTELNYEKTSTTFNDIVDIAVLATITGAGNTVTASVKGTGTINLNNVRGATLEVIKIA